MSWIATTDPLALVAIAAGQVPTPASETGAAGGRRLDTPQRAVELGEPVPIVFGRRRNSKGGILISPGATEARFENDASNNVTAYYMLVLSEGQIDSIPVKDVFQRACRVGAHTQTYNRRAGTWTPGNAIVAREGYDKPECPYYCGTKGAYPEMSTLSFSNTIPNGFDQWNRQVHCFIRGGMHVIRLNDAVEGPSDSFADLVYWMLSNSGRVPNALIDTDALTAADLFLEENGFTCNCWITESQNYADLLAKWAPYFLLGDSNNGGKRGLRPLLPVTETGAINTGAISWKYAFNEDTILPGSLEIQYTSLADRLPFVAQITWRQQLEDDFGIIRTAEVRYSGTAESGPYESHDLSAFCTSEDHAVKVGAYLLAKRVYTTHTIRLTARPQAHNTLLSPGDIIRVTLDRTATIANPSQHDYLYQVESISKTLAGDVSYECTHFPVDSQGRSLVALDVAAAQGTGILLTSNKTGVGCDVNSSSDNTIPAETWSTTDNLGVEEVTIELAEEDTPYRSGVFSFTGVTVGATNDPNIWSITVSATCDPPPINTSDGIEQDNVPPGPKDQLSITLDNGQTFYIPPLIQPATEVQGQLIFEDDVSSETLPVTRTLSVTSWSGGGFDELDVTDTINYTINENGGGGGGTCSAQITWEQVSGSYPPYITPPPFLGGSGDAVFRWTLTTPEGSQSYTTPNETLDLNFGSVSSEFTLYTCRDSSTGGYSYVAVIRTGVLYGLVNWNYYKSFMDAGQSIPGFLAAVEEAYNVPAFDPQDEQIIYDFFNNTPDIEGFPACNISGPNEATP